MIANSDFESRCPSLNQLNDWLDGSVDEAEADTIINHLDECLHCVELIERSDEPHLQGMLTDVGLSFLDEQDCVRFVDSLKRPPITEDLQLAYDRQSIEPGKRFERIAEHARGGLGRVSIAQDREVHRKVALKEILPELADIPSVRRRFLREAEITGQLEHPGIVPIYSVGQNANGQPYYAMRFIGGVSLADEIRTLHDIEHPQTSINSRLRLRSLLSRFNAVCDAANYAHQQNIVHRDIKPSNIMLGDHGETLLVDWGLAKRLGQTEADDDLVTETLGGSVSSPDTKLGSTIGTRGFMSPEQAAGDWDQLSIRSDVFSLAATLYQLLTGQPPYRKSDSDQLTKALAANFPHPKSVNPSVPAPLAAIVCKGMSSSPENRYGTAREMADEIEHWMADEPVDAYSEPLTERANRFARRHRTAMRAATAGLLFAATALFVSVVMINSALVDRSAALKESERQLQISKVREYATHIASASLAIEKKDYVMAQESLDACDIEQRSWEHQFLQSTVGMTSFEGHTDKVFSAAISNDGATAFSHGLDGTLRIWDVASGKARHIIQVQPPSSSNYSETAVSQDDHTVVVRTESGKLVMMDVESGTCTRTTTGTPAYQHVQAIHPSLGCFAASTHSSLVFFDKELNELSEFSAKLDGLARFAISQDGKRLATWCRDGKITVWNVDDGTEIASVISDFEKLRSLTFDASGNRLLTAGDSHGKTRQWDAQTGRLLKVFEGHDTRVNHAAYNSNGRLVVSCDSSGFVQVLDSSSGEMRDRFRCHSGQALNASFFPATDQIMTCGEDCGLRVWEFDHRPAIRRLDVHDATIASACFTPDGRLIVSGGHDKAVRVSDVRTGEVVRTLGVHNNLIVEVAVSPDGKLAASTSRDKHTRVWEIATGREMWSVRHDQNRLFLSLCFSADGTLLLLGDRVGGIQIRDLTSGELIRTLSGENDSIKVITASRDGRYLASGSSEKSRIEIWDAQSFSSIAVLEDPEAQLEMHGIRSLAFDASATTLFSGARDSSLIAWDVPTRTIRARLTGHTDAVDAIVVSHDGRRIITGGWDQTVRLWDTETFQHVFTSKIHAGRVRSVAQSFDGRLLLSSGTNKTLLLYDRGPSLP